jgi:hypothetical protein
MNVLIKTGLIVALLLGAEKLSGTPVIARAEKIAGLTIYADSHNRDLYFYRPGALTIATDPSGAPDLHYSIIRHHGTAASGRAGEMEIRSFLSFRVRFSSQAAAVSTAEKILQNHRPRAQLKPLPIIKTRFRLVFSPAGDGAAPIVLNGGLVKDDGGTESEAEGVSGLKSVLICPDPVAAEALWRVIQTGQAPLSLACELMGPGFTDLPPEQIGAPRGEPQVITLCSDALAVFPEPKRWPDRYVKIDVSGTAPREYALLQVLCFDADRDGPVEFVTKEIEVEASDVTGRPVRRRLAFSPRSSAATIGLLRFGTAIRLDQPYRYRVQTVALNGANSFGPWLEGKPWPVALDITSRDNREASMPVTALKPN